MMSATNNTNTGAKKMTAHQASLIEKLNAAKIESSFNGRFLNCKVAITSSGKIKWQKFSFVFDSAADCQGSRLAWRSLKGAYSEHLANDASDIIVAHSEEIARQPIEG